MVDQPKARHFGVFANFCIFFSFIIFFDIFKNNLIISKPKKILQYQLNCNPHLEHFILCISNFEHYTSFSLCSLRQFQIHSTLAHIYQVQENSGSLRDNIECKHHVENFPNIFHIPHIYLTHHLKHLHPHPYLCLYQYLPHPTQNVNYFPNTTHKHEILENSRVPKSWYSNKLLHKWELCLMGSKHPPYSTTCFIHVNKVIQ